MALEYYDAGNNRVRSPLAVVMGYDSYDIADRGSLDESGRFTRVATDMRCEEAYDKYKELLAKRGIRMEVVTNNDDYSDYSDSTARY